MQLWAFGFGSTAMLGWLIAAGVPLLIHLLSRRRYREAPWAAMSFLQEALKKHARRLRLEQLLLLLLRTAIIVSLVLAVAQPVWEALGMTSSGGKRAHKVIVLDGSFSMALRNGENTLFEQARRMATELVDDSASGDGFSLLLMSDPPRVVVGTPALDPAQFLEELESLEPPDGAADLSATMEEIRRVVAEGKKDQPKLETTQIFVYSDMCRNPWDVSRWGTAEATRFRETCQQLAKETSLVLIDLGQEDASNVAVTRIEAQSAYSTSGQEFRYEADVRNFGRSTVDQLAVEWLVDGKQANRQTLSLAPGAGRTTEFRYRFLQEGDHTVVAQIAGDSLAVDDQRYLAQATKTRLRALCVNGKPLDLRLSGATDYLTLALAPEKDSQTWPIDVEVATETALAERDLESYDVVFLCNVAQFTSREADLLRAYLAQGGGVVFFLGDETLADRYNLVLGPGAGEKRLLPATLGEVVTGNTRLFDPLEYRHPLLRPFKGQNQAGLVTRFPLVQTYMKLDDPSPAAQIALAHEGGQPLIVTESMQKGQVILVGTSADASWNTWPLWPTYLPMIRSLVNTAMRGQADEQNVRVGEAIGGRMPASAATSVRVRPPSGEDRDAAMTTIAGDAAWSESDTGDAGIYMVSWIGAEAPPKFFAVNPPAEESDLARIDPAERPAEFTLFDQWRESDEPGGTSVATQGEMHRWLLAVAVAMLLFEVFLAWKWGHSP